MIFFAAWIVSASVSSNATGAELRVAVASNFKSAAQALAASFEASTGHQVVLLMGSTGKHASQIQNGLVVDVFLAADSKRPQWLEQQGLAVKPSRFTYALGRLVLWHPHAPYVSPQSVTAAQVRRIAIANPKLAPYGVAALETLRALNVYHATKARLVMGENIAQAYQFVTTGNAQAGLLAWSQLKQQPGHTWLVPANLHAPIEQQAILIRPSEAGRTFLNFLRSEKALALIRQHGYDTP